MSSKSDFSVSKFLDLLKKSAPKPTQPSMDMGDGMILTEEMKDALSHIENGENVFITGNAGTGKTVFLRYLNSYSSKKTIITAPTGVAAINAGGVTIHSVAQIRQGQPLQPMKGPNKKVLETIDSIIIDEVSMARCDLIDLLDKRLREVRGIQQPFGGVQIIMFGDLFQLPPVVTPADKKYLSSLYPDVSGFFFYQANIWKLTGFYVCPFTKIFRQSDQEFIDFLGRLRTYQLIPEDYTYMSSRVSPNINSYSSIPHLCSTNQEAADINLENMRRILPIAGQENLVGFHAEAWGDHGVLSDKEIERNYPCESQLYLLPGAKVMVLTNESGYKGPDRYVNGSIGEVLSTDINSVTIKLDSTGRIVEIPEYTWEMTKYTVTGRGINKIVTPIKIGECTQIPLKLAWGITIHKSQGLTFNEIAIHNSRIFEAGQLYVALSRCRSYQGLHLSTGITEWMVKQCPELLEFLETIKQNPYYRV